MSPRSRQPTPSGDGSSRRLVGRYRLDSELGRGAMGTVWSAYDEVLHRPVAVKEVRLSLVPVQERAIVRERTLREARSTAMLSHPNVVTLYDVVEVDSEPYVVMELLPSRSLAAYIGERGRLTQTEAAEIGSAVASALTTAHRAGITHRDVKPGNVLIGEDGQIKLTDFGIARNAAEQSMTQTGTVLGSPPYIAPEVAMGRAVGPAADLWGLGATLYACLEGRPPYDGGDPVATVSAVVHGEIPVPTSSGPVTDVIRGLMVKDPAQRMPLAAVRRRLRPLLSDPEGPVLSPPTPATGLIKLPPREQSGSDRAGLIPLARPDRPTPPAPRPPSPRPSAPPASPPSAAPPPASPPSAAPPPASAPPASPPSASPPSAAPSPPPRPSPPGQGPPGGSPPSPLPRPARRPAAPGDGERAAEASRRPGSGDDAGAPAGVAGVAGAMAGAGASSDDAAGPDREPSADDVSAGDVSAGGAAATSSSDDDASDGDAADGAAAANVEAGGERGDEKGSVQAAPNRAADDRASNDRAADDPYADTDAGGRTDHDAPGTGDPEPRPGEGSGATKAAIAAAVATSAAVAGGSGTGGGGVEPSGDEKSAGDGRESPSASDGPSAGDGPAASDGPGASTSLGTDDGPAASDSLGASDGTRPDHSPAASDNPASDHSPPVSDSPATDHDPDGDDSPAADHSPAADGSRGDDGPGAAMAGGVTAAGVAVAATVAGAAGRPRTPSHDPSGSEGGSQGGAGDGSGPGTASPAAPAASSDQTVVGGPAGGPPGADTRTDRSGPRRPAPRSRADAPSSAAETTRVTPRPPGEDLTSRVPRPHPRPHGAAAPTPAPGSPAPGRWTPPPGTPRAAGPPPPRPAPPGWGPQQGPGAPLAADPGPLPFTPSPEGSSPARRRMTTVAVVVLVVVLGLAGALGVYALTRAIAGQPPLSLSLQPGGQVVAGARLIDHDDSDARYSGTGMKFSALVPAGWQQYRLQQPTDDVVVRFVSPDADRELRVDRIVGYYPARRASDYAALLADPLRVGADRSAVEPLVAVGPPRPGAREAAMQTVYRTASGPADDRTTWTRLVPSGVDLWIVRLTATTSSAAGAPEQFGAIADSFTPRTP